MTKKIDFVKLVAAGNDFLLVDNRDLKLSNSSVVNLAKKMCDRKYGAGADGLLLVEKSAKADYRMRIINSDGTEAEMCGNGSRCFALYCAGLKKKPVVDLKIQTLAGMLNASVNKDQVKVNLTAPKDFKLNVPVKVDGRTLHVHYINTGVPHAIVFAQGLSSMQIVDLGRQIRYHKVFAPKGTNVDFVEVAGEHYLYIRTYERGVEDETLACGTGSVASALVTGYVLAQKDAVRTSGPSRKSFQVHTRGGEILNVYFNLEGSKFSDVWLEGRADSVYKGVWYV